MHLFRLHVEGHVVRPAASPLDAASSDVLGFGAPRSLYIPYTFLLSVCAFLSSVGVRTPLTMDRLCVNKDPISFD